MLQAIGDDPGKLGTPEYAGAVTVVEMLVPAVGETVLELLEEVGI
jgi:hypothetical protein